MIFDISDKEFISIMNAKKLDLPKRWDGGDFHQELNKLYEDYLDKLRPFRELIEYPKIDNLCTEILKVVDEYLNGHIKEAYESKRQITAVFIKISGRRSAALSGLFLRSRPGACFMTQTR